MSVDAWRVQAASSWKLSLPCTRAEAEAIDFEDMALSAIVPPPVLLTSERVEDDPESWQLEAFFEGKPNSGALAAVQALVERGRFARLVEWG